MVPTWFPMNQSCSMKLPSLLFRRRTKIELYLAVANRKCLLKIWRVGIGCMTPLLMRLSKLVFVGWSISMQSHRRVLLKTFSSMQQKTIYLFGTTTTKLRVSTVFHLLPRSLLLTFNITHTQQVICSTTDLSMQSPMIMSTKLEALEPFQMALLVLITCFLL